MNADQNERWKMIQAAPLINPEEDELFTRKLVRQNGWSRCFADRCIAEYRRFVFLSAKAGHPVSPPDPVDQVWHLHLTYTHAYWKVFCPEVLGQPLHHWPGKGGSAEVEKFQDWYQQTLESYRTWFGSEPPDIWPTASAKAKEDQRQHRRVDTGRYWLCPKPKGLLLWARVALAVLPPLVAVGCSALPTLPPHWNVDGPTFLGIYLVLMVVAVISSTAARRLLSKGLSSSRSADDLKLYEMAFLAGGARRVLQSMLVRLHEEGAVLLNEKAKVSAAGNLVKSIDPMEETVCQRLESGEKTRKELRIGIQDALAATQEKLVQLGLLVPEPEALRARLIAGLLMGSVMGVGALRIWHAVERYRPFGFLVVLLVVTVALTFWLLRRPFRTPEGDAVLARAQAVPTEDALRQLDAGGVFGAHSALAVGLFGVSALAGTPLENIKKKLGSDSAAAYVSGCGSTCGSGGGDGGGGGGCGGGGCGGCSGG